MGMSNFYKKYFVLQKVNSIFAHRKTNRPVRLGVRTQDFHS